MEKETLLYKYFKNSLSQDEQVIFDKLLAKDDDFRKQLEFEENVKRVIVEREKGHLKKKLQGFEAQRPQTGHNRNKYWKPLQIAASVAILFVAGWYLYTSSSSASPEELYASNYEIYPNTVYSITRGDSKDNSLERKAFEAYEGNNPKTAIVRFEELAARSGLDYIDFYLAQANLADGQFQKALDLFENIIKEQTDFKTESYWYAALANIKLGNEDRAISHLNKLIIEGYYKKVEAKELLEELK